MVAKAGSGRMSPVRARTMKEYDQVTVDLGILLILVNVFVLFILPNTSNSNDYVWHFLGSLKFLFKSVELTRF